jgi:hypothetical protein
VHEFSGDFWFAEIATRAANAIQNGMVWVMYRDAIASGAPRANRAMPISTATPIEYNETPLRNITVLGSAR